MPRGASLPTRNGFINIKEFPGKNSQTEPHFSISQGSFYISLCIEGVAENDRTNSGLLIPLLTTVDL